MDTIFTNAHILSWLQYFAAGTEIDLEHVKILDITKKNKNLIPTVESHRTVLVFTEAGHADIFYRIDCHDSKSHLEECKRKYVLQLREDFTQLKEGAIYTYEGKKKRAEILVDRKRHNKV